MISAKRWHCLNQTTTTMRPPFFAGIDGVWTCLCFDGCTRHDETESCCDAIFSFIKLRQICVCAYLGHKYLG